MKLNFFNGEALKFFHKNEEGLYTAKVVEVDQVKSRLILNGTAANIVVDYSDHAEGAVMSTALGADDLIFFDERGEVALMATDNIPEGAVVVETIEGSEALVEGLAPCGLCSAAVELGSGVGEMIPEAPKSESKRTSASSPSREQLAARYHGGIERG